MFLVIMHRKLVLSVAAVFLIIALVIPPALVIVQTNNTIYKNIIPGIYPTQGTTNITITVTPQQRDNAVIAGIKIETIFIVLFAITLYLGINHSHLGHKSREPKITSSSTNDQTTTS